jgi:hypothetical protein
MHFGIKDDQILYLYKNISQWNYYHCANEAAHNYGKQASSSRKMCLWINFTPLFLVDILAKDCNPTS